MKKILALLIIVIISTSSYSFEERWVIGSGAVQIDKQQDGKYSYSFWKKGNDTNNLPDELINNGTFDCVESYDIFCSATGGGNEYYTFTQGSKKYIIHPPGGITSEPSPEVSMDTYINGELILEQYMCSTQRCMDRAKDESNSKLVFEGFRQWKK